VVRADLPQVVMPINSRAPALLPGLYACCFVVGRHLA
jgi:hypothetical protein